MANKKLLERLERQTFREPKEYWGAVAMLDALGTRERDRSGAREYLDVIQIVVNDLLHQASNLIADRDSAGPDAAKLDFDVMAFGDTLVISAGIPADDERAPSLTSEMLALVGSVARDAVYHGIQSGILFRGAVASGMFVKSKSMILGSCVTEAATWYDKADWIGVVLGARTGLEWGGMIENIWSEYPVPVKVASGRVEPRPMYALSWANQYIALGGGYESVLGACLKAFAAAPIPFGSESKAQHTLAHLRFMRKETDTKIKALARGRRKARN